MALGHYFTYGFTPVSSCTMKKTQDTPSRHADKYIVRFPEGMRDRISAAAERSGRSINAEIVARLEESLSNSTNPNMVASLARLSVALAMTNTHRLGEQTRSMILHGWVRMFGERLLPLVKDTDPKFADEIKFALQETSTFFHSPRALQHELTEQAVSLRNALQHLSRLGGVEEEDPALADMFAKLTNDEAPASASPDAPPPAAPKRITRKVTKKTSGS